MTTDAAIKVLVTGGAGFIGSELVRRLFSRGTPVRVVDNLINGRRENLEGISGCPVELVIADIRDSASVEKALHGIAIVYHLACLGVRHSIHSPRENHEVNATGTLRLLSLARKAGVERFVHVSTSEVYGTALRVPMDEDHPAFPMTVYGAAKLAGECYARAFYRTYGFPTVIVRPFNTFGPRSHHEGDCGEVIPKFMLRCLAGKPMVIFGDGSQTRDFTYVTDIAEGILTAGIREGGVGETINLGSGFEVAIEQLAGEVRAVAGNPKAQVIHAPPRPGDTLRLYADISRARSLLDFQPKISLGDGLKRLKQWYGSLGKAPEELLEQETIRNWEEMR